MLVLRRDAIITRVPSIYGWVSPFSARGPTDDALLKPDMIAPGERVLSSSNGEEPWVFASGTSVSTAHVAGAAALLRAQFPEWTPSRLKDALVSGAKADFRFAPYFSAFEKGAGTLLLAWLAQWPGFASPSSLSLGEALPGSTLEGEFDLTQFDLSGIESPETAFSLTFDQEDTFRSHEVAFVPSDEEGRAVVRFSVTTDVQSPVGDFSGAVSAWRGEQRITLPFAYRTVPPIGEEVLLLDLTFSSPPDAARIGFYQQLVLNAGAIPDLRIAGVDAISASDLLPFRAIVAFTGDDQAHMDTRVADAVLHALSAYVQRGGALLLAGQGALAGSHHPRIFHCLGAAPDADVSAFVSDAPVQANGAIPGAPAEPFLLRGATAPPTADLSVVHTWRYLMSSGSPVPLGMPLFQTIETGGGGALLGVLFDPYRYYSRHPALWKTRGRSAAMGFGFEAIADGERAQSLFTWLLNWLQERLELALDVERYADGYTVIHARVTGANGVSFEYRFNEDEFTVRSASAQIGYVFDETKDNRVTVLVWSAKGAAAVATADIPASGDETDDGRDDSDGEGTDIPGRVDVPVDERIVRVRDCSCNMVGEGIGRTLLRLLR